MERVSKREFKKKNEELQSSLQAYQNIAKSLEDACSILKNEKAELQEQYDHLFSTTSKLVVEYAKYEALYEIIKEKLENFEVIKGEAHLFE